MDLQMQVAEYAKKQGMRQIPQVLWIFADLVDDERVMHNNIITTTTSLRP